MKKFIQLLILVALPSLVNAGSVLANWGAGTCEGVSLDLRLGNETYEWTKATLHAGQLTANETWSSNSVHLVTLGLTVPSGVTLTIETNTVVKFVDNAYLDVAGSCVARGVIFTHVDDDSVGGDTLNDGTVRRPVTGLYLLKGNFTGDDKTEYRYVVWNMFPTTMGFNQSPETRLDLRLDASARNPVVSAGVVVHDGSLVTNETWVAAKTHLITSAFYIPEGRTLTIETGAVVKFCTLSGLIVNNGGNCVAKGVTFTHIGDDTIGGETRYNGDIVSAQEGLYVISGTFTTDETTVYRYLPQSDFDNVGATTSAAVAIDERANPVWILADSTNLAYSTRWDGSSSVTVTELIPSAVKTILTNGTAVAEGEVTWMPDDGVGEYAFEYITEKNTFNATFIVPVPAVITNDLTLVGDGITHFVPETVVVTNGATLTILPGAIVKFAPGTTISVDSNGNFKAVGSVNKPIIFTSAQDSELGLTLPGFGTTPTAYDWPAFIFAEGANARLDYVEFRYCGALDNWLDIAKFGDNTTLDASLCGVNVTNTSDRTRTVMLKATKKGIYSGNISGNVAVTKTGAGTLTFAETQKYTGITKVKAGTLQLANEENKFLEDGTIVPNNPEKAYELWKNNFLVHRWSFNGTLEDTVGGQTAELKGSNLPTFQGTNSVIRLPGGNCGTGWVNLGANVLPTNGPVTIEIWAKQNAIKSWSRVFDFGYDTCNYLYLSWNRGSVGTECFALRNKNYDIMSISDAMHGFALNEMFHISATFVSTNTTSTVGAYYKIKPDAGETLAQRSFTVKDFKISQLNQAECNLGHSFFNVDSDAAADYNEVRIWNAALSQEQLEANAKAGPDNVLSLKTLMRNMPSYEVADGATLDVNGGTLYCNNITGEGIVQNALLATGGSVDSNLILQGVAVAGDDSPRVRVTFDLAGRGTRSGGGALCQDISLGTGASSPIVKANGGWRFIGWDCNFDKVTQDMVVTAQYQSMRVDLQVTEIAVTNTITSGEIIDLDWVIGNFGNVDFNGKLSEEVRLVNVADSNNVRVVWNGVTDCSILTNTTLSRCEQWQIPLKGWTGDWHVQVETAIGAVYEVAENNITTFSNVLRIVQAALPDLSIQKMTLSALDLKPLDTVTVSYVVQNTGDGVAKSPWVETLYATQGETIIKLASQTVTNDLAAFSTTNRVFTTVIPQLFALSGNVGFYVKVDSGDALVEKSDDESAEELATQNINVKKRLYLTTSKTTVAENNSKGIRITVRRSGAISEALTVNCGINDDMVDMGSVPATVAFAAGARTVTFDFIPVDNTLVDGEREVVVTVNATDYEQVETTITITDDEVPSLTLSIDQTSVKEGDGVIHATVTRDLVTDKELVVYISGTFSGQCSCPTSVTIPAGKASVSFDVTLINDANAEAVANLNLKATASGFTASTQQFTVTDDDVPGVTFTVTPGEVSEGAGVNAIYAMLSRTDSDTVNQAITVKFRASKAGRLIIPETVTIPAYTMGIRFAISTVDNDDDDGDQEVVITGQIKLKNGALADPSDGKLIVETITIYDDDVPALSLKAEPSTMKEGVEHAGDLILSHNSILDEDLVVSLTVDLEGEIAITNEVVIPTGELSVTIPVTTLADGVTDGGRLVSIYADDLDGIFKSASTWLQISDVDLPDFRVESVNVPISVYAGKKFETSFAISNRGFVDWTNDIPYAVYLLKGTNTQPSENTKVSTGKIAGGLATNETTELIYTLSANDSTGNYRVAVVVDPNSEIGELDEADNTTYSSVISVGAAYAASVGVVKQVYIPGESVVITGKAVLTDGVSPAAQKAVDVYVIVEGARRVWSVITDANGLFTYTFTPIEGEAGHYGVGAVYPGINATTIQSEFDILGFRRTSSANIVWDVSIGDVVTNVVKLQNLSKVDLTKLAIAVTGVPEECKIESELASTLPGNGFVELRLIATALADSPQNDYSKMVATITTAEGLTLTFPLYFHSKSLKAQLKVSPSSIDAMMTVGATRYFEVTVKNDGRGASGKITIALPEAPYLRLVSQATLDNLASGETAVITFEVAPETAHNLVLNSPLRGGKLAVNCVNGTGASVALAFTPVSEETGSLIVDALDNNTYMLESAPHLEGATVRVTNPYTGAIVASTTTDKEGKATFNGLPQGKYNIRASAPNHSTATDSVTVEPGDTVKSEMFLAYQLVSATWDVKPVEIEDSYEVTLVLDFETTVPAPQVKITMPTSFVEMMPGDTTAFTIHVANTGLIRADEITFTPPTISGHTFVFQDNGFALAAGAARDIAVKFSRNADDPAGHVYMTNGQWAMITRVAWPCGKEHPVYEYPTYFSYGQSVYTDPIEELLNRSQSVRTYNESQDDGPSRDFNGNGEELDVGNLDDMDANTFVKTKGQAKVSLKLSQKLTMTREAFDGTLTVYNGNTTTPIRDLKLTLNITDSEGNVCNGDDTFLKLNQGVSGGISGGFVLDGGAEIAANDSGTAQIRFIPTRQAAETEPTVYNIGGTLTYIDPTSGEKATLELVPVTITVHPSPYLKLDYFVQRDVYGDDPLTENVVEAIEPAEIAVMVRNTGTGDAKGVTIASAQPEIFRNESGLDIAFSLKDFDLADMAIDGASTNAGLKNVELGTIPAGETKLAQWWLTSTLSGHFIGMTGTVTPLNSWNTPDTALVDSNVGVHKLIRSFVWDGQTHFLTCENDNDITATPDTIYTLDGEADSVYVGAGATIEGTLIGDEVTITVSSTDIAVGWNYLTLVADGISRYEVVSIMRSDTTQLPVRCCWLTDRVFRDGDEPLMEDRIHIVDSLTTGEATSWQVVLKAKPSVAVEVTEFDVENEVVENTLRDSVVVTFSTAIDSTSFTTADIVFKHQGSTISDLSKLTITSIDSLRYRISGFAELASNYGRNQLMVQCAGIANLSGRYGETGKSVAWLYSSADAPYIIDVTGAPVTRVNTFDSMTTVMSVEMDEDSFDNAYVTLNGKDISDRVTFACADVLGTRWTISGLDALQTTDGTYTLSIDCSSLKSSSGTSGLLSYSQSWIRDTVAPSVTSLSRSYGMGGNSYNVALSEVATAGSVSASNFTLKRNGTAVTLPTSASVVADGTGGWTLTGIDSVCQQDGNYELAFNAQGLSDEAGNVAVDGSKSVSWKVNLTPPDEATAITVSSTYGSVTSRVITASQKLTIGATVPEDGLEVEIVAQSLGGGETLLATPSIDKQRMFSTEIELPGDGNYTVVIRLIDEDGNKSETTIPVYVDGVGLTASLSGAPDTGHAADKIRLDFSEAVEAEDVLDSVCALTFNGESITLSALSVEQISPSSYVIVGLEDFTADYGDYVFAVDVSNVRKLSSGKTCDGEPTLTWKNELVDEIAPYVTGILFDGETPNNEYIQMFTNVMVTFSEKVNIAQLIRKGTIGQALYVELLDDNTNAYKVVRAENAVWDDETYSVTWDVNVTEIPCALARVVINASSVKDMAGNLLAPVDTYETIRSAKTYLPSILMASAAASYAAPALKDWNNDGLLDLIVGELTPDGKGKIRIYLNRGSVTNPKFEDFTYIEYNDIELEFGGGTDLGVHISFLRNGNRYMQFVSGDGCIYSWHYGYVNRKTGQRAEIEKWDETVADYPDFAVVLFDVNGDLQEDMVTGESSGNVVAYLGMGNNTFDDEPLTLYANEGVVGIVRIAIGDLTGDGLNDIVVGRPDGSLLLLKASLLQSQVVGFERIRIIPIDEALTLDAYWEVGDGWVCEQVGYNAKAVCVVNDGSSSVITSRFENAGTVYFKWGCTGDNNNSVYSCAVDGSVVLSKNGAFAVTSDSIRLEGDGSHYVEWRLDGNNKAILYNVSFNPDDIKRQVVEQNDISYADIRSFARGIWSRAHGDYNQAIQSIAANGRSVVENCIAGLDCDDPQAKFVAKITVVDGEVQVTWDPALNDSSTEKGVREGQRVYHVFGKKTLEDTGWTELEEGEEEDYNYFKVEVEKP